eukprot:m.122617 g.122617  ORF g.122617 m.122617 type:complete len:229 (-) comp21965_c0_seq2:4089-4775(-)
MAERAGVVGGSSTRALHLAAVPGTGSEGNGATHTAAEGGGAAVPNEGVDVQGKRRGGGCSGAVLWPVTHIKQSTDWDCGFVAARMVLQACGSHVTDDDLGQAAASFGVGAAESLWTIDICYILDAYSIRHCFCTTHAGASEELAQEDFYAKTFVQDAIRVNRLFADAKDNGLDVQKRRVPTAELYVVLRLTWRVSCSPSPRAACLPRVRWYAHQLTTCRGSRGWTVFS